MSATRVTALCKSSACYISEIMSSYDLTNSHRFYNEGMHRLG